MPGPGKPFPLSSLSPDLLSFVHGPLEFREHVLGLSLLNLDSSRDSPTHRLGSLSFSICEWNPGIIVSRPMPSLPSCYILYLVLASTFLKCPLQILVPYLATTSLVLVFILLSVFPHAVTI